MAGELKRGVLAPATRTAWARASLGPEQGGARAAAAMSARLTTIGKTDKCWPQG
jgi:hypothetical protein